MDENRNKKTLFPGIAPLHDDMKEKREKQLPPHHADVLAKWDAAESRLERNM